MVTDSAFQNQGNVLDHRENAAKDTPLGDEEVCYYVHAHVHSSTLPTYVCKSVLQTQSLAISCYITLQIPVPMSKFPLRRLSLGSASKKLLQNFPNKGMGMCVLHNSCNLDKYGFRMPKGYRH